MKKKRIDMGLLQKDVARLIGVTEDCITYWENNRSVPQVQYAPAIILFLGHNPFLIEEKTLGNRVRNYRYTHGLTHKQMGKQLGVNGTTIGSWETNEFLPAQKTLKRIADKISSLN